jgi:hypothetical protein
MAKNKMLYIYMLQKIRESLKKGGRGNERLGT